MVVPPGLFAIHLYAPESPGPAPTMVNVCLSSSALMFKWLLFFRVASSLTHSTVGAGLPLTVASNKMLPPSSITLGNEGSSVNTGGVGFSVTVRSALQDVWPASFAAMQRYVPASERRQFVNSKECISSSERNSKRGSPSNVVSFLSHFTSG